MVFLGCVEDFFLGRQKWLQINTAQKVSLSFKIIVSNARGDLAWPSVCCRCQENTPVFWGGGINVW